MKFTIPSCKIEYCFWPLRLVIHTNVAVQLNFIQIKTSQSNLVTRIIVSIFVINHRLKAVSAVRKYYYTLAPNKGKQTLQTRSTQKAQSRTKRTPLIVLVQQYDSYSILNCRSHSLPPSATFSTWCITACLPVSESD